MPTRDAAPQVEVAGVGGGDEVAPGAGRCREESQQGHLDREEQA